MGTNSPPPPSSTAEVPGPTQETTTTTAQKVETSSPTATNPKTPASTAPASTPSPTVAPAENSKETPVTVTSKPPEQPPPSVEAEIVIYIPSYSRWFSWDDIHDCEVRFLPEFFDGRSNSKNPRVYQHYRNSIIKSFRQNPARKITFTEARKTIIGDVGSVRRVFDFLEAWGLINYSPASASKQALKWEEKEAKSSVTAASVQSSSEPSGGSADFTVPKRRLCSVCKTVCSIACFASDKYDLILCARCYVRRNYQAGINSSDFKRVEINEEVKTDWTEKETLQLLEAAMHFGDDWKRVAEYVGGRSESECVAHFIKLPFGEQFVGQDSTTVSNKLSLSKDQNDAEYESQSLGTPFSNKKMRLNPLADASNPIMAQAAFLSALGGVEVSDVAARAAVNSLSEFSQRTIKASLGPLSGRAKEQGPDATSNGDTNLRTMEGILVDAQAELEEEDQDLERAISYITDVQMKEIQDKILKFEECELIMEREWEQLQQMEHQLFVDQLTLLFQRNAASKAGESVQQM